MNPHLTGFKSIVFPICSTNQQNRKAKNDIIFSLALTHESAIYNFRTEMEKTGQSKHLEDAHLSKVSPELWSKKHPEEI